ncbi:MAG: Dabb family protein [Roseimicrobium sp.]
MKKATALFAVVLTCVLTSCAQFGVQPSPRAGNVEHVVLIWLNEPGNAAHKEQMIAAARAFPQEIPGILAMSIGDAVPSEREVVDDSFDLAFVMRFKDKAALDAYEKHPVHVKAVKEVLAPHVSKLKVYDVAVR